MKVAIEMHPNFVVYNPETMLRLREIAPGTIGCNFDQSHMFWQGVDVVAAIRALGESIYHVHAKDCRIDPRNVMINGVLDAKKYTREKERSWIFRTCGYGNDAIVWKDIVSNLRLAVNMQAAHKAAAGDPSFLNGSAFGYGAHYCNVPREVDPEIAACSFLNSGLRIFDIRNPLKPREVAYFVSPPGMSDGSTYDAAFSQPAFDPARREVWYSDATTGFYVVKLAKSVWPHPK